MTESSMDTTVKKIPILFSPEMVQAILSGRKTVTRRIVTKRRDRIMKGVSLYVRERFAFDSRYDQVPPREVEEGESVWYLADGDLPAEAGKVRPGIFMPKWSSRIELYVTGCSVEALQDITEQEARAEGVGSREEFRKLWIGLNGRESWDCNPKVKRVEFRMPGSPQVCKICKIPMSKERYYWTCMTCGDLVF